MIPVVFVRNSLVIKRSQNEAALKSVEGSVGDFLIRQIDAWSKKCLSAATFNWQFENKFCQAHR